MVAITDRRHRVLRSFTRPLTAKQLAAQAHLEFDTCRHAIRELARLDLIHCLNPEARRHRIYWLTQRAHKFLPELPRDHAQSWSLVDWALHGWASNPHPLAVLRALTRPMKPAELKRAGYLRDRSSRMTASHYRDTLRMLVQHGLVQKTYPGKKKHALYGLTETGRRHRSLLV